MKRVILSLLLAVCLTIAFALPVFAQGNSDFGKTVAEMAQASRGAAVPDYVLGEVPLGPPE